MSGYGVYKNNIRGENSLNNTVIIKGNKSGMTVVLDREISFEQLLKDVKEKFTESSKFWGNAQMAIQFEGRRLTSEQERRIIDVIEENSSLNILCILDNDQEQEQKFQKALTDKLNDMAAQTGQFYKGTLRSGQVLESEGSIIILGDVNPGGKVIAKGNIVVLGALKGIAYSGVSGNESAFVCALEMAPMQIRIGDIIARSPDGKRTSLGDGPMIAYIELGNICIQPLNKNIIHDINFI